MNIRRQLTALTVIMAILVVGVGIAVAQGPSGTYASGIACTNLSTTEAATILIQFIDADSANVALTYVDPIPVPIGGSRNYFTPVTPPGLAEGFVGSAVVSSNVPLACNVNTQVVSGGVGSAANPARVGTSAGVDGASTNNRLFAPQVLKSFFGYNSYIAVQNAESNKSINVTVDYTDRFGVAYGAASETVAIPALSTHIFYQASNADLPTGFLGGATIDAGSDKMAAVVNFYNSGANAQTAHFHSYNAFPAGGAKLFVPRFVRNFYGFNSGMSVQNVGGSSTSVTVTYTFGGSTYIDTSGPIAPGATYAPYAPSIVALNPVDSLGVGARTGSAVIEAAPGGSVVAIINEDNRGTCNSAVCPAIPAYQNGFGSSYNAFLDGEQSPDVFFAQVPRAAGSIFSGGFQIGNTTGSSGTCSIAWSGQGAAAESGVAIAANGSLARFAPGVAGLPDGFNSSVVVSCTVNIVGISNFSSQSVSYVGDSFVTGNGLNQ